MSILTSKCRWILDNQNVKWKTLRLIQRQITRTLVSASGLQRRPEEAGSRALEEQHRREDAKSRTDAADSPAFEEQRRREEAENVRKRHSH